METKTKAAPTPRCATITTVNYATSNTAAITAVDRNALCHAPFSWAVLAWSANLATKETGNNDNANDNSIK